MGGGLMQLVAYGAQDIYLTGNPEITFFKAVYQRHTNFAMEQIAQSFSGDVINGGRASCTISRNGDLIGDCLLEIAICNSMIQQYYDGEQMIKSVELEIGGQQIDKHDCYWFRVYDELNRQESEKHAYSQVATTGYDTTPLVGVTAIGQVGLPLIFSFNRNPGLYLPLIALQYHEVKLIFEFNAAGTLATSGALRQLQNINPVTLYANYIYLDTEERRRFAQNKHEYLIDQLQIQNESFITSTGTVNNIYLNFNHPVKYIAWFVCADEDGVIDRGNFTALGGGVGAVRGGFNPPGFTHSSTVENCGIFSDMVWNHSVHPFSNPSYNENGNALVSSVKLTLNGHDRFETRGGKYFRYYQPFQHFGTRPVNGIYCYSFALRPAEHQPSGTCNFSRIDNSQLMITRGSQITEPNHNKLKIYAVNYNVLRVQSGMGGLAYSN